MITQARSLFTPSKLHAHTPSFTSTDPQTLTIVHTQGYCIVATPLPFSPFDHAAAAAQVATAYQQALPFLRDVYGREVLAEVCTSQRLYMEFVCVSVARAYQQALPFVRDVYGREGLADVCVSVGSCRWDVYMRVGMHVRVVA